jgi:hypothetical protein
MSRKDAQIALAAAQLIPRIRTVTSNEPKGTVTGQKPAGGKSAARGATVTLTVSKGPAPAAVNATVELTDDGNSIRANKEDITVPKGSLVRVSLSTTITCAIESNRLNVDGQSKLANGDSVTLSATAPNEAYVACPGLGEPDAILKVFVLGTSNPTASPTASEPLTAALIFDGNAMRAEPNSVELQVKQKLVVTFQVKETCALGADSGPVPEFVDGDGVMAVGTPATLKIDRGISYTLKCTNLKRAEKFIIRGGF